MTNAHHAPALIAPRTKAKFSICPHEVAVGSPNPRNDKVDSFKIASEITRMAFTTNKGITNGRMCFMMIWTFPAPMARARKTNLRDFTASVCERTMRAVVVHPKMPMRIFWITRVGS